MTTQDIVNYYADQLIIQYRGQPQAYAMIQALATPTILPCISVQAITFTEPPTAGQFVLSYNDNSAAAINWNDTAATIQADLRALIGLSQVTVSGSIASQILVVTFIGVPPVALQLIVVSSTLVNDAVGGDPLVTEGGDLIVTESGQQIVTTFVTVDVTPVVAETDDTLPIQVQNAFNMTGDDTAVGVQLDTLGKYNGVVRSGIVFNGTTVTLDDTDFLTLIFMAISRNSLPSDLASIQNYLQTWFQNEIFVFDYQNMHMSYLISTSVGSTGLVELFVSEDLLPRPMGVDLSVVLAPVVNMFFGFGYYERPAWNVEPFNTYESYNTSWPWLDYADAI